MIGAKMFVINRRDRYYVLMAFVLIFSLNSCVPAVESASAEKGVRGFQLQYKAIGNILGGQSDCCSEEVLGARLENGFTYVYVKFHVNSGFDGAGFIFSNPIYLINLDDKSRFESHAVYPNVEEFYTPANTSYIFRLAFPATNLVDTKFRLFEEPGCPACLNIGPFTLEPINKGNG